MTLNKLLLSAAAIAVPLGIADAQQPTTADTTAQSTGPVAGATATPSVDQPATTDSSAQTASADQPMPVTKADVTKGATVLGKDGGVVGKIESVSADAAVVATGKSRAQIPMTSFGKTSQGLVIAMSKTELEAAASGKAPS